MEMMKVKFTGVLVQSTLGTILQAIKRNGLEKTLEDLEGVVDPKLPESTEDVYQGMLGIAKLIRELGE